MKVGRIWAIAVLALGSSCFGELTALLSRANPLPGSDTTSPSDSLDPRIAESLGAPVFLDGKASALRRLSRDELMTSIELLTGHAPDSEALPHEPRVHHEILKLGGAPYIGSEVATLKTALEDFATTLAPTLHSSSGCKSTGQAQQDCLLSWASNLATAGLRQSLAPTEADQLKAIVARAGLTTEEDLKVTAAVLSTVLFSPSLLYRIERGEQNDANPALRTLTQTELASRVSYLATLGPPDAELLQAAQDGRLSDGDERAAHFDRLTQTARGKKALATFLLEWLGSAEPKVAKKGPDYVAGLPVDFQAQLQASFQRTVDAVLDGPTPTLGALLTTDVFLDHDAVKRITSDARLGTTDTGDSWGLTRIGLLMHPLVVSAQTKEYGASPFQLGVFLRKTMLCESVGSPPAGATDLAQQIQVPEGLSLREQLDHRTSGDICRSCHSQFAPLGYAFLPFDPVGRWMNSDGTGKPWNLSGSVPTHSGQPLAFDSPTTLVRQFAEHDQVRGCFAQTTLKWVLGRGLLKEDEPLLTVANEASKASGGNVRAIFRALVRAPDFALAVAPKETP